MTSDSSAWVLVMTQDLFDHDRPVYFLLEHQPPLRSQFAQPPPSSLNAELLAPPHPGPRHEEHRGLRCLRCWEERQTQVPDHLLRALFCHPPHLYLSFSEDFLKARSFIHTRTHCGMIWMDLEIHRPSFKDPVGIKW